MIARHLNPRTRAPLALATLTLALLAPIPGASVLAAEAPAQEPSYSLAERSLFMADHFHELAPRAAVLNYAFTRSGSFQPPYEDKVRVEVGAPATSGRPVKMEFLSGEHKVELPEIEDAQGNPVIMGFLERDVREMSRITGGGGTQGSYYKKRLRMAMVDTNQARPVTVRWAGHEVKAQEFTLDPYKDDPARARYTRFANKTYTFVLSDQVPGHVYSLKTVMRDPNASSKIMIEETLTLQETP